MQLASRKPADVAPNRMGALAKLPVFLDLQGKRVVIAGGSPMAAWKAELVAAAGADVEIYAGELSAEMQHLISHGAAAGSIVHIERDWTPEVLEGAALAMADALDEEAAETFWNAARAAGILVNVIDKPAFCQFQFGSIVNRSPVVVAISTDGGSPILAQAIRRRIETLLPPALATWGSIAKALRGLVNQRLTAGAQRRAFWERLAERAFTASATHESGADATRLIDEIAADDGTKEGRVTLVGAGPGDAELLTLKAVRAMQSADVILFDDLVSDDVLELARREAKRMLVGKRGKRESCAQGDINELMIRLAKQGKHVVRLKSGDPMIFGRAGEEIAALVAEGIRTEVVPGVTSALAAAARLGVSLTHRDLAHSVRFMTGHARNGELPEDLDWRGLADPATTLMVYMGGRTAGRLVTRLIDAGLPATTPCIVVTAVSRAEETRRTCTAGELAAGASAPVNHAPLQVQPVLIGIGDAFGMSSVASAVRRDTNRGIPTEKPAAEVFRSGSLVRL